MSLVYFNQHSLNYILSAGILLFMGNQWVVANLLYKKIVVAVFYYEIVLYVSVGDILYVFMSKKN